MRGDSKETRHDLISHDLDSVWLCRHNLTSLRAGIARRLPLYKTACGIGGSISTIVTMFESVALREPLPKPLPSHASSRAQIIDIRSDKKDVELREALQQSIHSDSAALPDLLLWDEQGLRLFEDVTYCPSYYLTREEIGLLENHRLQIADHIQPGSMLVELGSGYAGPISMNHADSTEISARQKSSSTRLRSSDAQSITLPLMSPIPSFSAPSVRSQTHISTSGVSAC